MLPSLITDGPKPTPKRVIGTLGLIALVTLVRWLLQGVLSFNVPFLLYFPSIMLIAWFGGTLCALIAIVLEGMIALWLFVPTDTDPLASMRVAIFVLGSVVIAWVSRNLHRARRELITARQREGEPEAALRADARQHRRSRHWTRCQWCRDLLESRC